MKIYSDDFEYPEDFEYSEALEYSEDFEYSEYSEDFEYPEDFGHSAQKTNLAVPNGVTLSEANTMKSEDLVRLAMKWREILYTFKIPEDVSPLALKAWEDDYLELYSQGKHIYQILDGGIRNAS